MLKSAKLKNMDEIRTNSGPQIRECSNFFSLPKRMLWVLKRTVSPETVLLGTKTDLFVFKIIITFSILKQNFA